VQNDTHLASWMLRLFELWHTESYPSLFMWLVICRWKLLLCVLKRRLVLVHRHFLLDNSQARKIKGIPTAQVV